MDVMVLIGLGAAAGVLVLLFVGAKLIRIVRDGDEFEFDRPRLFGRRRRSTPFSVAPLASVLKDDARPSDELPPPVPPPSERVAAYAPPAAPAQVSTETIPSGRSEPVKHFRKSNDDKARASEEAASMDKPETRVEAGVAHGTGDYGRLGEQVTAVLTTAEHAAAEIRETASREAEAIRLDADQEVAAARAEAEAVRAEANSYAAETRRAAEAEAAQAREAGEQQAQAVQAEAERKAKKIEAEALRRRDALRQSAVDLEKRIAEMITTFRAMTIQLEGLLPAEVRSDDGEPAERTDVVVDDALEDALKPERAASR